MLRHRDSYTEEDERESREKGRESENQSTWEWSREIWPQACMWACTEAQAGSWSLTCMVAASASRSWGVSIRKSEARCWRGSVPAWKFWNRIEYRKKNVVVVVVVVSSPTSGRISDETTAAGDGGAAGGGDGCKTRGIALSYRFAQESDEAPPIVCRRCRRIFLGSRSLSRTHHPKDHTHTKNTPFYQRRRPFLGWHNLVKKKGEQMTRVGGNSSSQKLLLLLAILAFRVLCDPRKALRGHQSSKEQQSHDATTSKHKGRYPFSCALASSNTLLLLLVQQRKKKKNQLLTFVFLDSPRAATALFCQRGRHPTLDPPPPKAILIALPHAHRNKPTLFLRIDNREEEEPPIPSPYV